MSDEEEVMSGEETEEEDEEETKMAPPEDTGPTEAELAMQRRRNQQMSSSGLDETAKDLLADNEKLRDAMAEEIEELRARSERRKQERQEEERELALRRQEEDARRKAEEEERKAKKQEEERLRREKRAQQMAEFAKFSSSGKPNFVITKKEGGGGGGEGEPEEKESSYMSREQLEQERKAILGQRITTLQIDGFDSSKLAEKCKSLHKEILRLEGEKYDLEKRFKEQQYDMMEMSERARQINQVGKTGLKRLAPDEADVIAQKYSGAPGKIEMYSKFERQQDKRSYGQKHEVFQGPTYLHETDRIPAQRGITWDEDTGIPYYTGGAPAPPPAEPAPEPVEAPAEEE